MSIISNLPKYVVLKLLSNWFSLEVIGLLDSALCNSGKRGLFLNILSQMVTLSPEFRIPSYKLQWIDRKAPNLFRVEPFQVVINNSAIFPTSAVSDCIDVSHCGAFANSIFVSSCDNVSVDNLIVLLTKKCPNLTVVVISFTNNTSPENTTRLIKSISLLDRLTELNFLGFVCLLDEHLSIILCEVGLSLQSLNVSGCVQLSDASIQIVCEKCKSLNILDISNLPKLCDNSLESLTKWSVHLSDFSFGCGGNESQNQTSQTLIMNSVFSDEWIEKYLSVHGEYLYDLEIVSNVSNDTLLNIAKHCKQIVSMRLTDSISFEGGGLHFSSLCESCKLIVALNVSQLHYLKLSDFECIVRQLIHLEDFHFARCSSEVQRPVYYLLGQKFRNIGKLDIRDHHVVGELYDTPPTLHSLQKSTSSIMSSWEQIAFDCVSFVTSKCSSSSFSSLSLSDGIYNAPEFMRFVSHSFKSLVSVAFHTMVDLTDDHLTEVANECHSLVHFTINSCPQITSKSIVGICVNNPMLVSVGLSSFSGGGIVGGGSVMKICDLALIDGISTLKRLQMLSLFHLKFISEVGFSAVVNKCKRLSELCIHSCELISESFVRNEVLKCPVLNNVRFVGGL
jgi:hypothetical protein